MKKNKKPPPNSSFVCFIYLRDRKKLKKGEKMNSSTVVVPEYLLKCKSVKWGPYYDERNFLYCVIRHLWPVTAKIVHFKHLPSKYERRFNLDGVTFPMSFKRINSFVQKNAHLPLTIRVLFESEGEVCVLDTFSNIRGKGQKFKNVLNLLMIKSDCEIGAETEGFDSSIATIKQLNQQHHFFNIPNIRAFLNGRKRGLMKASTYQGLYYCEVCLMHFWSKEKKNSHRQVCQKDKQTVLYPPKGSVLNFSNQKNAFKAPVIGFADFECYMEDSAERQTACAKCGQGTLGCDCEKSSSQMLNKHRACGFSICFVDSDNDVFYQETYAGADAVEVFLEKMPDYEDVVAKRKQRFRNTSQIIASEEEWRQYHDATHCHICKKGFVDGCRFYKKVVDHDHVSGAIIQAAHSICNLQRQGPYRTPIYFHNAQG